MSFIFIDDVAHPVDTLEELKAAKRALSEAGLAQAQVWVGSPDCPDSYPVETFLHVGDAGRSDEVTP